MAYEHMTDDATWPPKVLWGSTVVYPSDSLASCFLPCPFPGSVELRAIDRETLGLLLAFTSDQRSMIIWVSGALNPSRRSSDEWWL